MKEYLVQKFEVWSPSIFDNDEVSQVYGEVDSIQRWTEVADDDSLKSLEWERQYFYGQKS